MIWKEAVMAQDLPGGTEENYKNLRLAHAPAKI
jgi:hypothetical protein